MKFTIKETMTGTHQFTQSDLGPLPFEFDIVWGGQSLSSLTLSGTISVDGLCEKVPCSGRLKIDYLNTHTIRYTINFQTNGYEYKYVGEKVNIRWYNLLTSHTTCFGTITDSDGKLISRSVAYFNLLTIPQFLLSFRVV